MVSPGRFVRSAVDVRLAILTRLFICGRFRSSSTLRSVMRSLAGVRAASPIRRSVLSLM